MLLAIVVRLVAASVRHNGHISVLAVEPQSKGNDQCDQNCVLVS